MATIREIDAWLLSHHGSATDCARALEPDADEVAFKRLRSRCSQQVQRLRASGALPPSLVPRAAVPAPASEPPPKPAPAPRPPVRPKPSPEPLRLVEPLTDLAVAIDTEDPTPVVAPLGGAARVAALLRPGVWLCGLTKGQFSLLDLVREVLTVTGPADVTISTWSTGIKDMESARWLIDNGDMRSLRLLTDRSFPARQPRYAARLTQLFGPSAIIVSRVHAKIAVIRNERWAVAIRSSMNLNHNPRFEQFDVNESRAACDFLGAWVDELQAAMGGAGLQFDESAAEAAFRDALTRGVTASEAVAEMLGETPEETAKREEAEQAKSERTPRERRMAVVESERQRRQAAADATDRVDLGSLDRVGYLRWHLQQLELAVAGGDVGSVARVQALKSANEVHLQLLALIEPEETPTGPSPETMTPDEWTEYLREQASALRPDDLEVFVAVWLEREGVEITTHGDMRVLESRTRG